MKAYKSGLRKQTNWLKMIIIGLIVFTFFGAGLVAYVSHYYKKSLEPVNVQAMDDINFTLDFLIDLYKVVSINEQVVYGDIKLSNDIFYKNKIGSIINDYLKLPDDYITVTDSGQVIEKSTTLLHIQLIEVFNKLQKKSSNISIISIFPIFYDFIINTIYRIKHFTYFYSFYYIIHLN